MFSRALCYSVFCLLIEITHSVLDKIGEKARKKSAHGKKRRVILFENNKATLAYRAHQLCRLHPKLPSKCIWKTGCEKIGNEVPFSLIYTILWVTRRGNHWQNRAKEERLQHCQVHKQASSCLENAPSNSDTFSHGTK